MRLIDADALARQNPELKIYIVGRDGGKTLELVRCLAKRVLKEMIADAPTIEAEPVRHGRWEEFVRPADCLFGLFQPYRKCSLCEKDYIGGADSGTNYCPNCGAKMDLEGE